MSMISHFYSLLDIMYYLLFQTTKLGNSKLRRFISVASRRILRFIKTRNATLLILKLQSCKEEYYIVLLFQLTVIANRFVIESVHRSHNHQLQISPIDGSVRTGSRLSLRDTQRLELHWYSLKLLALRQKGGPYRTKRCYRVRFLE